MADKFSPATCVNSSLSGSGPESDTSWQLLINKQDLTRTKFKPCAAQLNALGEGEVLMKVKRVSFTANNITYALMGESMSYWRFFPCQEESWGILPVWGFAVAEQSRHENIEAGSKYYGYWPLATHLIVQPTNISVKGFVDKTFHRQDLPAIYNQYHLESNVRDLQSENLYALLNPLFTTSYLIDDFLREHAFFGAHAVVLSSASSKTALATAFLLKRHRSNRAACKIIGLTSAANLSFTTQLKVYDEVVAYDDLNQLADEDSLCYIDFSGNTQLRSRIHNQCADRLKYSGIIGATHWENTGSSEQLPGPSPTIFFAPSQYQERAKAIGITELQHGIATAWDDFMRLAMSLNIIELSDQESVQTTYRALLEGNYNPADAYIFVM